MNSRSPQSQVFYTPFNDLLLLNLAVLMTPPSLRASRPINPFALPDSIVTLWSSRWSIAPGSCQDRPTPLLCNCTPRCELQECVPFSTGRGLGVPLRDIGYGSQRVIESTLEDAYSCVLEGTSSKKITLAITWLGYTHLGEKKYTFVTPSTKVQLACEIGHAFSVFLHWVEFAHVAAFLPNLDPWEIRAVWQCSPEDRSALSGMLGAAKWRICHVEDVACASGGVVHVSPVYLSVSAVHWGWCYDVSSDGPCGCRSSSGETPASCAGHARGSGPFRKGQPPIRDDGGLWDEPQAETGTIVSLGANADTERALLRRRPDDGRPRLRPRPPISDSGHQPTNPAGAPAIRRRTGRRPGQATAEPYPAHIAMTSVTARCLPGCPPTLGPLVGHIKSFTIPSSSPARPFPSSHHLLFLPRNAEPIGDIPPPAILRTVHLTVYPRLPSDHQRTATNFHLRAIVSTTSGMASPQTSSIFAIASPSVISRPILTASPSTYLLLALSTLFVYLAASAVHRLFFSPLSALPGPWYAAVSDLWLTTHVVRLQQCRTVQALFDRYGPVVRVGPNKVVFCDATAMKSVYCVHKFDKSSYYKSLLTSAIVLPSSLFITHNDRFFCRNNNDHAMTTLPNAQHAVRRKAYAPHYTPSNLALFQPELHDYTLKLVDTLFIASGKASVDCLDLFRHLMVDIIGSTVFGSRPGSLDNWALNIQDPLATAVYDFPKRGVLRSAVPAWAWDLVCRIPSERWRQICDSDTIMAQFVAGRLYEMRTKMQAGPVGGDSEAEKVPLLQRMLQYRVVATHEGMADRDIISEGMGHLVAGVDTSSTTLSYLFWEISRRPDIMQRLQAELDEAMPDRRVIPDFGILSKLPYLNAFMREGFRIYGAAPSLLERVVTSTTPPNVDDSFDLMGYALPPGTIVSTQAWSMHRDPDVFPSPETFLPERWLEMEGVDGEEDRITRMTQHMMPFGVGTRICGGQNLAHMVLRIVVTAVVSNFKITANAAETNERSMDMRDAFVTFPAARECKLVFTARKP
ncbi:uncharacterized protein FIBRA_02499 [Fibroporia radiculosa]|uniref:Cytochrome P450 n=1 Tax=Fibroporia radiculosa TaxID=599839 RepID=J4I934_9APHY|nr:uncharacterized protein FIBRA_02499 [Fibroporia radiculosa]CCM00466.1 predicted protein [Fibroporia radiculosa]